MCGKVLDPRGGKKNKVLGAGRAPKKGQSTIAGRKRDYLAREKCPHVSRPLAHLGRERSLGKFQEKEQPTDADDVRTRNGRRNVNAFQGWKLHILEKESSGVTSTVERRIGKVGEGGAQGRISNGKRRKLQRTLV